MNHLNDTKDFKDMILSISAMAGIPAIALIKKIHEDMKAIGSVLYPGSCK